MRGIIITDDVARALEERLGIDFDQVNREAYERREAAIRKAQEESQRRRAEREAQRQEIHARTFAEELGDTILVRIDGKMITDAEALVCPHCGAPHAPLSRFAREAGMMAGRRQMGHKKAALPLGYPDTDKRWMNSPVLSETVRCETCGGYFDAVIVVLP